MTRLARTNASNATAIAPTASPRSDETTARSAVRVMAGNLAGLHVGTRLMFGRADIDQHRDHPGRLDDVADVRQLLTLRVERPDDVDRLHREIRSALDATIGDATIERHRQLLYA